MDNGNTKLLAIDFYLAGCGPMSSGRTNQQDFAICEMHMYEIMCICFIVQLHMQLPKATTTMNTKLVGKIGRHDSVSKTTKENPSFLPHICRHIDICTLKAQ